MKKKVQVAAASSLLLLLGACNYGNNAANDRKGDNLNNPLHTRNGSYTTEGLNTSNRYNNNIITDKVNYRSDKNGFDNIGRDNLTSFNRNGDHSLNVDYDRHSGVLNPDIDMNRKTGVNNQNVGFNRNTGFNNQNVGFNHNTGFNNQNVAYYSNGDTWGRNRSNGLGGTMDDTISADFTTTPSGKYPHTKAIQIQPAKFGYIVMDPRQGNSQQFNFTVPNQNQSPTQRNVEQYQSRTFQPGQQTQQQYGFQAQQPNQTQVTRPNQTQMNQVTPAQQPTQPQKQTQPTKPAAQTTKGISATEQKVIELTNVERRKNGVRDLVGDTKLSSVARTKSNDMQAKGYFSHTSPTYGSPFDMMRDFGVTYKTAGENIAQGQRTPEEVVRSWMNSEGHRKNILNGSFTHIGVGHNTSGNEWTQMFIGK